MTHRNNGHTAIHANRLVLSTPDTVALGLAVEERFNTVFNTYLRLRGEQLPIPQSLDKDIHRWRTMRVRHKTGDLRNSDDELQSVKSVAQWTCNLNAALKDQLLTKIDWPS